jgi:pimeloyl-ACP methyl ester carboxylesterase
MNGRRPEVGLALGPAIVWSAVLWSLGGASLAGAQPVRRLIARDAARLEVLDWGGRGLPLVFLPGLGNTARVYDSFAARFRDRHRVLAFTPRPWGGSLPRERGVPLDTVLTDLEAVLDTLGLRSVVLVGNSLGGDLATFFAARFPDRVRAVIYLDGANDRRPGAQPPPNAPWPPPPAMTAADSASPIAYRRYVAATFGPPLPLAEIRATIRFDRGGRYAGELVPESAAGILVGSLRPAPFREVRAPALALYPAFEADRYDLPYWSRLAGADRTAADSLQAWATRSEQINEDSIRVLLPGVRITRIPRSGHLIFLLAPDAVERAMRAFLGSVR